MSYVFFGTPRFAEIVLERLFAAGMPPAAVVCNPDRPLGRKKIIAPPPVKRLALSRAPHAAVFQPEALDENFIKELRAMKPDLFVVAAYAKIIPQAVLVIPARGAIGVHPSLLPKYRGAAPIQSAIMNGERETGVTLYLMDEKMDHGPILARASVPLDARRTDYAALERALAELGGDLLVKTLPAAAAGRAAAPEPQDETQATYTKKFATDDGRVDETDLARAERGDAELAAAIVRKINALTPEPGVWTVRAGKRVKLLKAAVENGRLKLLVTQREGEKPRKE